MDTHTSHIKINRNVQVIFQNCLFEDIDDSMLFQLSQGQLYLYDTTIQNSKFSLGMLSAAQSSTA